MRLIDADVTYDVITDYYHHRLEEQHEALKDALSRVPAVDAEPVRHGKWEYDVETAGFKCTECGKRIWGMTLEIASGDINYCPKCGAKMDGQYNG